MRANSKLTFTTVTSWGEGNQAAPIINKMFFSGSQNLNAITSGHQWRACLAAWSSDSPIILNISEPCRIKLHRSISRLQEKQMKAVMHMKRGETNEAGWWLSKIISTKARGIYVNETYVMRRRLALLARSRSLIVSICSEREGRGRAYFEISKRKSKSIAGKQNFLATDRSWNGAWAACWGMRPKIK